MNPLKILFPVGATILFFFVLTSQPLQAAGSQDRL